MFAPFILGYASLKVIIVIAFTVVSFLLTGLELGQEMAFVGVVFASLASGLGEVTFLGYMSKFEANSISAWSSGTGRTVKVTTTDFTKVSPNLHQSPTFLPFSRCCRFLRSTQLFRSDLCPHAQALYSHHASHAAGHGTFVFRDCRPRRRYDESTIEPEWGKHCIGRAAAAANWRRDWTGAEDQFAHQTHHISWLPKVHDTAGADLPVWVLH